MERELLGALLAGARGSVRDERDRSALRDLKGLFWVAKRRSAKGRSPAKGRLWQRNAPEVRRSAVRSLRSCLGILKTADQIELGKERS